MVVAPLGRRFSLLRAPLRVIMSMQHRDLKVKIQSFRTCDDDAIGVMPFLEAPHLETRLGLWQWWWSASGVA
jgi:hypothetical protein